LKKIVCHTGISEVSQDSLSVLLEKKKRAFSPKHDVVVGWCPGVELVTV
jgi:hypothetical protein